MTKRNATQEKLQRLAPAIENAAEVLDSGAQVETALTALTGDGIPVVSLDEDAPEVVSQSLDRDPG